ncbi:MULTISPECIES: TolC family protein [Culturomica]|uniref:TolC family protein n=1 Tax=Culturomica TaxID=1926651 RepID=UPI0008388C35|nr:MULTISPECIES: TolC family protein [Culturomica]HBO26603.1 TolC family protein [Culturomica sp.]
MKGVITSIMIWLAFSPVGVKAQDKPEEWNLSRCIRYAREQNIQVKKSKISLEENREQYLKSKAQLFPSLSFSSSHNWVNRPKSVEADENSYSGNYGFSSSVALYQGGQLRKQVRQQELQNQIQELYIREAENNIEIAITESFLQVLYAMESVGINKNTEEVSRQQCERARQLYTAGSISKSDLAQLESQYSTDKYQTVAARATLEENRLSLKQLLELNIMDDIRLNIPSLSESDVLKLLPSKQEVYTAALDFMPEIAGSRLSVVSAQSDVAIAKAGYLPSLNLTAGIGTSHVSGSGYSFSDQLRHNFNESVGVTLSVPIAGNRKNKSAVKLAQLSVENAELDYLNSQKELLKTVETVYLDALSSQNRYKAAMESVKAAMQSYSLVEEQFNLGMKNTVELLTEKNNLLAAQQELVQAKYMAVLNLQLLNFYQGKGIQLN